MSRHHIAEVAHRDHHRIIGIEVLSVELMLVGYDLCTAVITVFLLHLIEIVFHHLLAKLRIIENRLQISNLLLQFLIFSV